MVSRKGIDVGRYTLRFRPEEDGFTCSASIEIAVKFAFMTAYRYTQTSEDLWRNGQLVQAVITTDDDGDRSSVVIEAQEQKLLVEGPLGLIVAPIGTLTDGSLWNIAVTKQSQVIDGQRGDLMQIGGHGPFYERISLEGKSTSTRRYTFQSDPEHEMAGTLWYDQMDRLTKIMLQTRGERLEYRLVG